MIGSIPREELTQYLLQTAGIAALVDDRVYSIHVVKAQAPYIVYRVTDMGIERTHESSEISRPRIEIACYAKEQPTALALARTVIDAMLDWPDEGYVATAVSIEGYDEGFNERVELYEIVSTFEIWLQEVEE